MVVVFRLFAFIYLYQLYRKIVLNKMIFHLPESRRVTIRGSLNQNLELDNLYLIAYTTLIDLLLYRIVPVTISDHLQIPFYKLFDV